MKRQWLIKYCLLALRFVFVWIDAIDIQQVVYDYCAHSHNKYVSLLYCYSMLK